eukprot:GEMP01073863.1.p1 GENE.GEMP01073863.1~~GEMP01073863.1.p1  ORF type:complete len:167 (+),score=29.44 GEMP01073863.1:229-729(+)
MDARSVEIVPGNRTFYKKVAQVGERLFSVYAGESFEFFLDCDHSQLARPQHQGGFFVYESYDEAVNAEFSFKPGGLFSARRVILECVCRGPFVKYGRKISCSHLRPLRIVGPHGALPPLESVSHTQSGAEEVARLPVSAAQRDSMRDETRRLEFEVLQLERRLGYR